MQLEPGDRLVLFTDGISEAGIGNEEFGEGRIVAYARECIGKSAGEIKSRILADVKQFCDEQLRDDATLIVIAALPHEEDVTKAPFKDLAVAGHGK